MKLAFSSLETFFFLRIIFIKKNKKFFLAFDKFIIKIPIVIAFAFYCS